MVEGVASANINPYVRPEFRDVTYMQGIDYHQDMIDFRNREADFVTCYIYLAEVGIEDSPIQLIPGSQRLGGTVFPHDLVVLDDAETRIRYRADEHEVELPIHVITGAAGAGYFWHSCMLHGTRLHTGTMPRVSIRYIIQKDPADSDTLLDRANREMLRSASLPRTRVDVDESGVFRQRTNVIEGDRFSD
jgi:ectoine hydroxylase-related dioxygenase (phytanoyl-CoA dioxygenase family)